MHEPIGTIVDMQKFSARSPAAPDRQIPLSGPCPFMRPAQEAWNDVRAFWVVVVSRTVEVGRHRRDEVAAILSAIGLA